MSSRACLQVARLAEEEAEQAAAIAAAAAASPPKQVCFDAGLPTLNTASLTCQPLSHNHIHMLCSHVQ